MTAKEYLSQAYHLDNRIKTKVEQAQYYYDIATKVNTAISGMPFGETRNIHQMDDAIAGWVDTINEIEADLSKLLKLQSDIIKTIDQVDNITYQTLLALRYLHFKPWREIQKIMGYESRYIFKVHNMALKKVDTIRDYKRP